MTESSRLTMALVGCGNIARAHWRGIRYIADRIDVTAVVDTDKERAQDMAVRTGGQAFTSLQEALEDGTFDAVDIMLPHNQHEAAAAACFAAGKHVCLEKPMSTDLASSERILAVAEGADTCFMVAEQAQYWPDVHEARKLMDAGAIGDIVTARGCFYDPQVIDPAVPRPWRYDLEQAGGGISMDGGAHWIRPLRIMLGEIDEVVAVTGRHIPGMDVESWTHALFRFENGLTASFDALLSGGATGPTEDFRITGTTGELVIESGRDGNLVLFNNEHPDGESIMASFPGKVDSYGLELKDFCEHVLDGKPLAATPEHSLGELRTAFAIYRSVETGTWEKVWV
jgi:predicted dehydrogenase